MAVLHPTSAEVIHYRLDLYIVSLTSHSKEEKDVAYLMCQCRIVPQRMSCALATQVLNYLNNTDSVICLE